MYLCAKDETGVLVHGEQSPGISRWVCPNGDWQCSETTAATCLGSDPPNTALALALEEYATAHDVVITDSNVVAITATLAPTAPPARAAKDAPKQEGREAPRQEPPKPETRQGA